MTGVIVDEPDQDRFSLLGRETAWSAPQLIRRWRRHWIALVFQTLQHLVAPEAGQVGYPLKAGQSGVGHVR